VKIAALRRRAYELVDCAAPPSLQLAAASAAVPVSANPSSVATGPASVAAVAAAGVAGVPTVGWSDAAARAAAGAGALSASAARLVSAVAAATEEPAGPESDAAR